MVTIVTFELLLLLFPPPLHVSCLFPSRLLISATTLSRHKQTFHSNTTIDQYQLLLLLPYLITTATLTNFSTIASATISAIVQNEPLWISPFQVTITPLFLKSNKFYYNQLPFTTITSSIRNPQIFHPSLNESL